VQNILRIIIALSVVTLFGLAFWAEFSGHTLLDVVLPSRVLADTTAERNQIADRLTASHRPSFLTWVPPIGILLLSSYGLFLAKKRACRPRTSLPHA
jgi:hypothetical protein